MIIKLRMVYIYYIVFGYFIVNKKVKTVINCLIIVFYFISVHCLTWLNF